MQDVPVVLILEDHHLSRFVFRELLEQAGYGVVEVDNEWDAVTVCGSTEMRIDLLVSDVILSGANGTGVAERLLRLRPGLPILFMSGYGLVDLVNSGLLDSDRLSTRVSFLQKPFSAKLFLDDVQQLISPS
jgi:CheY-like chemotaxis protein